MFSVFLLGAISSSAMCASFSVIAADSASCLGTNEVHTGLALHKKYFDKIAEEVAISNVYVL